MYLGAFVVAEALLSFTYYALITVGCENMAYRLRQRIFDRFLSFPFLSFSNFFVLSFIDFDVILKCFYLIWSAFWGLLFRFDI
jgi:hypothetical protein